MTRWLLVLLMCLTPLQALAQVSWPNKPVGATTLTECNWNALCSGWTDAFGSIDIQSDGVSNPIGSPATAARDLLPAGAAEGGSQLDYYLATPTKDIYIGVVLRTNTIFSGNYNNSNKIFLIISDDTPSVVGAYGSGSGGLLYAYNNQNFGNLNNCHLARIVGDCPGGVWFAPTVFSQYLVRGTYQKIELRLKSSTTDTSRDGWILMWVDGQQVYNITTANTGDAPWRWVSWNHTWGGLNCTNHDCTKDREWWLDHLIIADANGGVSPPPPSTPPPPPSSPPPPPASPGGLSPNGSTQTPGSQVLSWSAVAGASYYSLRAHKVGTPYEPVANMTFYGNVTGTSQTITTDPSAQYDWWVFGVDAFGQSGGVSGAMFSTSSGTATPPPPSSPPPPPASPPPATPQIGCVKKVPGTGQNPVAKEYRFSQGCP